MTEEDVPPVVVELTSPVEIPPQPAELEPQAALDVPQNDM